MIKKTILILFAIALLAAFGGTLWFLWDKSQEEPIVYKTESPFTATIIKKTVATGSVVPRKENEVKPQVSGILDEIYIEPGKMVTEDDLIAKVTIVPNMISLAAAENRLSRAKINLENAETEFERNQQLWDEGVLSEANFKV